MSNYEKGKRCASLLRLRAVLAAMTSLACSDPRGVGSISVPADSAAGEVDLRLVGPGGAALVVSVHVNGRGPVDLILDTGATLTCVDTAFARELQLPDRRMALGMAVGVGGSGRVRLHTVDSLRVGAVIARDLTVCSLALQDLRAIGPDVRGLLGLNVLRNFRVTLDFDRGVVRLAPPGEPLDRRTR